MVYEAFKCEKFNKVYQVKPKQVPKDEGIMKLKYVLLLWAVGMGIPVLLFMIFSSLGLPTATSLWIIIIVLVVTSGITIRHIMKEERADQLELLLESEATEKLKQKEKAIMILSVCFFVIGALLWLSSTYYTVDAIASHKVDPGVLSTLNILGRIGSFMLLLSFILIIIWAVLRDKWRKMKSEILKEEIGKVLEEERRIRS